MRSGQGSQVWTTEKGNLPRKSGSLAGCDTGSEKARVLPLYLKNPKAHSNTMKQIITLAFALALLANPLFADHHGLPKPDKDGWITLINGKDLAGWDGNPKVWSVKDGYVSGQIPRLQGGNTFLGYKHPFSNFELEAEWVLVDGKGNSSLFL